MFTEQMMGTTIRLAGVNSSHAAATFGWLRDVERTFSRFQPGSDVSRVNAAPGTWVPVSEQFVEVMALALDLRRTTEGLCDPLVGDRTVAWGYDEDLPLVQARRPRPVPGSRTGAGRLELDREGARARLVGSAGVDLGGVVKGWAADRARRVLQTSSAWRGMIDLGGDIATWDLDGAQPWRIGVENPVTRQTAAILTLSGTSIATSSTLGRAWNTSDGVRAHHLIDPRTGDPARSDLVQTTVITSSALDAEAAAKTVLILGSADGPRWLARAHPGAGYLGVDRSGHLHQEVPEGVTLA